jgi:hypothetical protein
LGVKFNTAEIEEMRNVGDMLDMIAAKRAAYGVSAKGYKSGLGRPCSSSETQ